MKDEEDVVPMNGCSKLATSSNAFINTARLSAIPSICVHAYVNWCAISSATIDLSRATEESHLVSVSRGPYYLRDGLRNCACGESYWWQLPSNGEVYPLLSGRCH